MLYFVHFQMAEWSITNLKRLEDRIEQLGLDLVVGCPTRPDGSCFLWSTQQNMMELKSTGIWTAEVPDDVEQLRAEVIYLFSF